MNESELEESLGETGDQGIGDFQYGVYGVVAPTVCILGIIGNVLAVIVLSRRRMRSSMSCYLIAQAIFDCIVLIMMILSMSVSLLNESYRCIYPYINPIVYPLALIGQTGTIYITVSFTVERYIAVCRPLQASNMCTPKRAIKVSLLVSFSSIAYNIPRMMELKTLSPEEQTQIDNRTHNNCSVNERSHLGKNVLFENIYKSYMYLFFIFLLPFLLLFTLNILLLRAVKDSQRARNQMNARAARENNLTIMVIVVVIVFLVCQLPALIDNMFVAIVSFEDLQGHWFFTRFTTISNVLVAINSAINFLLYCVFGNKFRRVFLQIFCCRKNNDRNETSIQMFRTTNRQTGANAPTNNSSQRLPDTGSRRERNVNAKHGLQNNNHVNGHTTRFIDTEDSEHPVDNDDPRRHLITTAIVATDDEV